MTTEDVIARVARSRRYRAVDVALVRRLADEEVRRGGRPDEVAKRVKRRLHQAVGAFAEPRGGDRLMRPIRAAWSRDLTDQPFRDACRATLAAHASTRERAPYLEDFYAGIWDACGGAPTTLLDLGCGLGPLALPWMDLPAAATYHACDADAGTIAVVEEFLGLAGQPHVTDACDLVDPPALPSVEVALLLKLVPTLDRQDPDAASRLLGALDARRAVVSFPRRSLGGRERGMERTYRARLERLASDAGRVVGVAEASVPSELAFVLTLEPRRG